MPMPMPAAPRSSPNPAHLVAAAVIIVLMLFGLAGQCGSSAETGDSAPTTSVPPSTGPAPLAEPPQPVDDEATVIDDIAPPPPPAPAPEPAEDYSDGTGSDDSGGGFASYDNCSAARAAGAAPLYVGDPGYSSDLDRDGDGVACES